MALKYLDPPRFKIKFYNDFETLNSCGICGCKKVKHYYRLFLSKNIFFVCKYNRCADCSSYLIKNGFKKNEYDISEGNWGWAWFHYWEKDNGKLLGED